jgi:hypothetical protein
MPASTSCPRVAGLEREVIRRPATYPPFLAAALAFQFGLGAGQGSGKNAGKGRSFRFVVIDEAFGRGSDESARYGLELFQRMKLQLLMENSSRTTGRSSMSLWRR